MPTVNDLPGDWKYLYDPAPTLEADGEAWTASLSFVTPQYNVIPFVSLLSGVTESVPYSGGSVDRIVTLQHPLYNWLWSTSFSCEAFGEASQTSTALEDLHSHAKINVDFRSTNYPTGGSEPYLTWETRGTSLYATIPGRKMKFTGGEVLGQDAGFFISQVSYVLTLYQAPQLNDEYINGFLNTVNNATFRGIPAGQLRFDTWGSSFEIIGGGGLRWTKQLVFTRQSHSWNQYYTSAGVLETALDPASNPTYPSSNFALLLGA